MMFKRKAIILLVLSLLLSSTVNSLTLNRVQSTKSCSGTCPSNVQGSLRGGTILYLTGTGFHPTPAENKVYVGDLLAELPDGLTDSTLMFQTPDSGRTSDLNSLTIRVTDWLTQRNITLQGYSFSYKYDQTPILRAVYPAYNYGGLDTKIYGVHRITDLGRNDDTANNLGDIQKIMLGVEQCDRTSVFEDPINPNAWQFITCNPSKTQEAGKYGITHLLTPGLAELDWKMQLASFTNQEKYYVVHPQVSSFSPTSGHEKGNVLTIKGTNFAADPAKVSVAIDGVTCDVTSSSDSEVKCKLQAKAVGNSAKIDTNTSVTQLLGYIGGAGWDYTRYDIKNLTTKTPAGLKAAVDSSSPDINMTESRKSLELETPNIYGENYGQVFKGYFLAKNTGNYIFNGVHDDGFSMYISEVQGSAQLPATPQIYSSTYSSSSNFFYKNLADSTATVMMTQGKYYYMELYHINGGSGGYLKISVQAPNTDTTLKHQTHQVVELRTAVIYDPEILKITIDNITSGTYMLEVRRGSGSSQYWKNCTLTFDATASQFQSCLRRFDLYSSYSTTVSAVETFDGNTATAVVADINRYVYTVQIAKYRNTDNVEDSDLRMKNQPTGATIQSIQRTQTHSPLLGGTFQLTVGGVQVATSSSGTEFDFSYKSSASTIQRAFKRIGDAFARTEVIKSGTDQFGYRWVIDFFDNYQDIPDIVVNTAGLTGTKASPTINYLALRQFSTDLLFDPIGSSFLFSASELPNVIVKVNSMDSACTGDCKYTFATTAPELTSAALSLSVLTLAISDPNSLGIALTDISVVFDGENCVVDTGSGSIASFTCQLPENSADVPKVRAGSHMPVVMAMNFLVPPATGVSDIDVPLTATLVTPDTAKLNGGTDAIITGHGFPQAMTEITVTVCSAVTRISSVSNVALTFAVPICSTIGAETVTIAYNSLQDTSLSLTFGATASPPSITGILPVSSSPVLKKKMIITGTGFGTSTADLKAYLTNITNPRVYEMKVLEATDTEVIVGIPGGLPGTFSVELVKDGEGNAVVGADVNGAPANQFVYELVISSISPTTGSKYGGTLLTITGINFSPNDKENIVFVGPEINWFCKLESFSATQIMCRTPAQHSRYDDGVAQEVVVASKLIQETTCASAGACDFTYDSSVAAPEIYSIDDDSSSTGSVLTVTGDFNACNDVNTMEVYFTNSASSKVTNAVLSATATFTSVSFTVPATENGNYRVVVRCDPVGESNATIVKVSMRLTTVVPAQVSVMGGIVAINGKGLPDSWPNSRYSVVLEEDGMMTKNADVVSSNPSQLVLKIPAGMNNRQFTIKVKGPLEEDTTSTNLKTSATPMLTVKTASITPSSAQTVELTRTTHTTEVPTILSVYHVNDMSMKTAISSPTETGDDLSFSLDLPSGSYKFAAFFDGFGWADVSGSLEVTAGSYTVAVQQMSYNGGFLDVQGTGISPASYITVGGKIGKYHDANSTYARFRVPPLATAETVAQYSELNVSEKITEFTKIADDLTTAANSFDMDFETIYESTAATCYIGIDMGTDVLVKVHKIRYFPNMEWLNTAEYLGGAIIQTSLDCVTYTDLATLGGQVHSGWNSVMSAMTNTAVRCIRLTDTGNSGCKLAGFEVWGAVYSNVMVSDLVSHSMDVVFSDGLTDTTWAGKLEFRNDATPTVATVRNGNDVPNGDVYGNYNITLTGTNLLGNQNVTIDNINCPVEGTPTGTEVKCLVGNRLTLPTKNFFEVHVDNKRAVHAEEFEYVMRWSDPRTWGLDPPPVDSDFVFVPKGMTLYVDQSTPKMLGITVEDGNLIFADEADMVITSGFITVTRGKFRAGTETKPHLNKLTFLMTGNYFGKQQPIFGNKGIGCYECDFSMHGNPKAFTWTSLAATADIGATSITLEDSVDWSAGDRIVIASTDFDYDQAEMRFIVSVSGTTVTLDSPLVHKHVSIEETYGTHKLVMKAEVGMYTRNIKMMGDTDTQRTKYGSHLLLAGKSTNGLKGQIAYVEFTDCGQPQIIGRYCHHFHMNGDVPDSFSRGNAVYNSLARVITIHGVYHLLVEENVGYNVQGHNYFVEDGIETDNVIKHNLAIKTIESNQMLQTDMSAASFWITNPKNTVQFNHAAGGNFYGFWYEIKNHPDGPSSTTDVCPTGMELGPSHDNVAHSNLRFGLRIFILAPRTNPCQKISDTNPSIQSKFYNYMLYKNGEAGLLAERTGNMNYENFTISDNKEAGIDFNFADLAEETEYVEPTDIAIIGISQGNPTAISDFKNYKAIQTPRSDGLKVSNVHLYNMPDPLTILKTCKECNNACLFINSARESFFSGITYTNVTTTKKLFMIGHKKEIVYDTDGSLTADFDGTTRANGATLTWGWPHIVQHANCAKETRATSEWDSAAICDDTVTIRRVLFGNAQKDSEFNKIPMKATQLSSITEQVSLTLASTLYSEVVSYLGGLQPRDRSKSWALPYATGETYNIWWLTGIHWSSLSIFSSKYFTASDDAIIMRFNYTQQRQLFEISSNSSATFVTPTQIALDVASCVNGDYYHDEGNKFMSVCISGRQKEMADTPIDLIGIKCRYHCPAPPGQYEQENFTRRWSNVTADVSGNFQWPSNNLPILNDNVTIEGPWKMLLDVNPPVLNLLTIKGSLIIEESNYNGDDGVWNITANYIWVRGELTIGRSDLPYTGKFNFILTGSKFDDTFSVTPEVSSNKMFVNTGKLNIYGSPPKAVRTQLKRSAFAGNTSIQVTASSSDLGTWAVGDQIAIAPSFSDYNQYEKRTITAITGSVISFADALNFTHYGSSSTTIPSSETGTGTDLDTRAWVGHLTRQIRVTAGGPDIGWGYRFINYGYTWNENDDLGIEYTITAVGKVYIKGVEFVNGGQYDTEQTTFEVMNTVNYKDSDDAADLEYYNQVIDSSFHECKSFCMNIENAHQYKINNNVMFKATLFHARINDVARVQFTNNLMIYANKRTTVSFKEMVSCYATYKEVDNTVKIQNNVCQGSYMHGFALPYLACDDIDNDQFNNNLVGTADTGYIYTKVPGNCMAAANAKAYACNICHMGHSPGTMELKIKKFTFADCGRAMTLRFGLRGDDRTAYVNDTYINAISRPNCDYCYGENKTDCSSRQGIRLLAVTINGEEMPSKFGDGYDVICRNEVFDAKAFLFRIKFKNFNRAYSQAGLSECTDNYLMRPHSGAFDLTGSHHFWESSCANCSINSFGIFDKPNQNKKGWFGGCGDIVCTGMMNYLIEDHDGMLTDSVSGGTGGGVFIPSNPTIGDALGCTDFTGAGEIMNGHFCPRHDLAVMEYESRAADFNTRIMWPVNVTRQHLTEGWSVLTNGYIEWEWEGNEPLNKRIGRFISVINLNSTYNITFLSEPPHKLVFQIQRRGYEGDSNDWVMIKMNYPTPKTIQVSNKTGVVSPLPEVRGRNGVADSTVLSQKAICGANKYFQSNYTTNFIFNAGTNCRIVVELTSSIKLTTRFEMNIDDFYAKNGETLYIDRMAALLGISDTSRIKIVGVYAGSVDVVAIVSTSSSVSSSFATSDQSTIDSTAQEISQIAATISSLIQSQALQNGLGQALNSAVLSSSFEVNNLPTTPDDSVIVTPTAATEGASQIGMMVGIAVGVVLLIVLATFGVVCLVRKRARITQEEIIEQSSDDDKNDKKKDFIEEESVMDFGKKP